MKKFKVFSQKQRRSKVVQLYVGVALFTAIQFGAPGILPDGLDGGFLSTFGYVALLGWLSWLLRPLGYAKRTFSDKVQLDERQQLVRYKAHRITFYITFILIIVSGFATLIYSLVLENMPASSLSIFEIFRPIGGGLILLLIVHYTMPLAMIAWLEPDPIPEKEERKGEHHVVAQ